MKTSKKNQEFLESEEPLFSRGDSSNTPLSFSHLDSFKNSEDKEDETLIKNLFGEESDLKSSDLRRFFGKNILENISKISENVSSGGEDYLVLDVVLDFPPSKLWEFAQKMDTAKEKGNSEYFVDGTESEVLEEKGLINKSEIEFEHNGLIIQKKAGFRDGKGTFFEYCFECFGIRFGLEIPMKSEYSCKIIVSSIPLMIFDGLKNTYQKVKDILRAIGAEILREKLSRIDICLDLVGIGAKDFTKEFTDGNSITKAGSWSIFGKFSKCTGFSIGKTAVKLRIYDKVEETKNNEMKQFIMKKKRWLCDPEIASRVEFQLNRAFLKKFEINNVETFLNQRFSIAHFLTSKWFRLVEKIEDRTHTTRAKISEIWSKVKEGFKKWTSFVRNEPIKRSLKILPDAFRLQKQILGCLMSFIAVKNLNNPLEVVASEMVYQMLNILEAKGETKISQEYEERRKRFKKFEGLFDQLANEEIFERAI